MRKGRSGDDPGREALLLLLLLIDRDEPAPARRPSGSRREGTAPPRASASTAPGHPLVAPPAGEAMEDEGTPAPRSDGGTEADAPEAEVRQGAAAGVSAPQADAFVPFAGQNGENGEANAGGTAHAETTR
jgi:hypothetical protein